MYYKKQMAQILVVMLLATSITGCTQNSKETGTGDKTNLTVGGWADETMQVALEKQNAKRDKMMKENPDINIIADTYVYDTKTYTMKATANQLPNIYSTWFTEIKQIIKSGYAADITDAMKKYGYTESLNSDLLKLVTGEDGKIYGMPVNAYAQGLYINKAIFQKAGLVNEDGSVKVPDTYEDVAEFSKIIAEKTGKAGFTIPTTNNCGGWHFLNIAWSFGVKFMEQNDDGNWNATFNTPEAVKALQYVKDLKWKYHSLPDESVIDQNELYKIFATGQSGMMFADPPCSKLKQKYNMNIDDIFVTRMPKGPSGRYSQMGGGVWMFSKESTEKQIDAGMRWLMFDGNAPKLTEELVQNKRKGYETEIAKNGIVLDRKAFQIWVDPERNNKELEIASEYTNVKHENYEQYYEFKDVTIKPEEPQCSQQLYAVLDSCIQEVITNENADCAALIATAAKDFQENHLNRIDK